MAEKDLIWMKPKGDPQSDAWRAKQKGSASPKRKAAQQVRRAKEKLKNGNLDLEESRILELVTNPEASAKQIQGLCEELLKDTKLKSKDRIALLNAMSTKHRTFFGDHLTVEADISVKMDNMIQKWRDSRKTDKGGSS